MDSRPAAIFLMGPTASGKTALALHLQQRLPCDIVSVDSALVYRYMNVGTAKPDAATLAHCPHRLIDILDPTEAYSAARFRNDALTAMREIVAQGRVPLLVGGTMLYFKALADGLSELPPADAQLRASIERAARDRGWPALHAELARVDPAAAARIRPADSQRIQRALEVIRITGRPMTEAIGRRREPLPFRIIAASLEPSDRAVLHRRIAARFDAMLGAGLVDELRGLQARFALQASMPSMRCVGYRQAWQFLAGQIDAAALRETGIAATRQLAKRQLTWLRAMQRVQRFDCLAADAAQRVGAFLEAAL